MNETISLCMIVKNESRFLAKCLESVIDIVDEIIVVDTGSEDNTIDIATKYGAKIYKYKWNNNFADARNYSLEKASKKWILLMDGDDELSSSDKSKVKSLLSKENIDGYLFSTISLIKENTTKDALYNKNLRLIRNNGNYMFIGAIHEQIQEKNGKLDNTKFKYENINIYHRGYLKEVIEEKNKRNRNIEILQEELKKNPFDSFNNFNMGNEYLALERYELAINYYRLSLTHMEKDAIFNKKLTVKNILAYIGKKEIQIALKELDEAIVRFDKVSDLYYLKGILLKNDKSYSLALKSFAKAIQINNEEEYILGSKTYKTFLMQGDIYYILKDYNEAIKYYKESIKYLKNNDILIESLLKSIVKNNGTEVEIKNLVNELIDSGNSYDRIISNLLKLKIYNVALEFLSEKSKQTVKDNSLYFLMGKALAYKNYFKESLEMFNKVEKGSTLYDKSVCYKLIVNMIEKNNFSIEDIEEINDEEIRHSMLHIYFIYKINEAPKIVNNNKLVNEIFSILDFILKSDQFELFEKVIKVLSCIDSNSVLLKLAKLYYDNGYYKLAKEETIRSIKIFNAIDENTAKILLL